MERIEQVALGIMERDLTEIQELLAQLPDEVSISERALEVAAKNIWQGARMMEKLLEKKGAKANITEDVVKAAVGNERIGKEVMTVLLEQRGADILITEEVMKTAVGNNWKGREITTALLKQRGADIVITEEVIKSAVGNDRIGKEIIMVLLKERGADMVITGEVIKAAAMNNKTRAEMTTFLLEQREADVVITEEVVKIIVGQFEWEVIALLFELHGADVVITEEVIKAATGNKRWGGEASLLLLKQRGADMAITEGVVKIIVSGFGLEVISLLLELRGADVMVTEEVVNAAARNKDRGKEIMILLLQQRGADMAITEEVVKAIASQFDREVMVLLLELRGPDVVKAAAENKRPLPGTLYRLHLGVLRRLRPRLATQYRRLEWKCNCGMPLYGDFRGSDDEIDKLVMEIQAHGFPVTQSGYRAKPLSSSSTQTTASDSVSLAPPRSEGFHETGSSSINKSQVVGRMPNIITVKIGTAASQSISRLEQQKCVALYVNRGSFRKIYNEVDIFTLPGDNRIFSRFKKAYEAWLSPRTDMISSWLTKPVDISYIQLAASARCAYRITGSPDCTICAHMENEDDLVVMRRYEPHSATSALAHPPIPSNLFLHLWKCPAGISPALQSMWLDRLPKKIDETPEELCHRGVRPNDESFRGWGILVKQRIHKRRVLLLTTAMAVIALVIPIIYPIEKKDVSSAFAIGAVAVAYWAIYITALYLELQRHQ